MTSKNSKITNLLVALLILKYILILSLDQQNHLYKYIYTPPHGG